MEIREFYVAVPNKASFRTDFRPVLQKIGIGEIVDLGATPVNRCGDIGGLTCPRF
ncbi:hypothetical protein [Burkholderia anthina]|uniref:hypothetical protein n=1 Tax=Burkholderia anthina TaxID=179879 RepID=UPI00158BC4E3|nr:hypothetical protein [Burkholderia anthina]